MDLLLAFVLAMSVTMALIPTLMRLANRLQILDAPGPRKVHLRPIPRIGGVAMVAGALVPLLFWLDAGPTLKAYLAAALLLLSVGVWDDRMTLGYLPKLVGQLIAAFIIIKWGGVLIHSVTLTDRVELPGQIAIPLTVLFLIGITNAINLADGLDGLAGGTTLLSCCAIAMLGLTIGDRFVATVAIVIAGSVLGFLRYNTYPARIFMGDGGSQFLGFTVAVIAILLTQGDTAPISAALPLLLLGVPILDTLMVMVQRISEGRSPFTADRNHIHHRLLALGFDHHEAVVVIYLLQAGLFLTAWFMRYESDLRIVLVFSAYAIAVLGSLSGASSLGWRWPHADSTRRLGDPGHRGGLRALRERLPGLTILALGLGTAVYALRVALIAMPIPADIGWLCIALSILLAALGVARPIRTPPEWLVHAALYVGAAVFVYLDITSRETVLPAAVEVTGAILLAASVLLYIRMTPVRRFRLTPSDFLVVFVMLTLPNLPGTVAARSELGLAAVKLLVLFYAVEMLTGHSSMSRLVFNGSAAAALMVVAWRTL